MYAWGPHSAPGHPMSHVQYCGKGEAGEASKPQSHGQLCHQLCDADRTGAGKLGWQEHMTESPVPDYEQQVTDGPPDQM